MKNKSILFVLATIALSSAADEPTISVDRDEASQSMIATLQRDELRGTETFIGLFGQNEFAIVDGNCLAELEGEHAMASDMSASISDDMIKLVGSVETTLVHATPGLTLDCGPFDDCLPCPESIEHYREAYSQTTEAGAIELPIPLDPEGCGGGDGPGIRLAAACAVAESPCAVTCQTSNVQ